MPLKDYFILKQKYKIINLPSHLLAHKQTKMHVWIAPQARGFWYPRGMSRNIRDAIDSK